MQSYASDNTYHLSGTPNDGPSRSTLPAAFARHEQKATPSLCLELDGERLDPDQKISQELGRSVSLPQPLAVSEPPPASSFPGFSPFPSPVSVDNYPETDLSSSPAAMFLSAFSPTVSELSLAPDDEGAVVAGYTLGPIVGHGGFSIIRTACSAQGGTVAVKIIRHSDLNQQPNPALARKSLEREAEVWASLNHEHILPLFTVSHTPYADFFFTAYCPVGSLFDILKRDGHPALPQDDVGMMFRQVVRGLRYMHEVAGFVHGDLKLENVLVDEMGVCKIGDFGMARKIGEIYEEPEPENDGVHRSRTLSHAHPPSQRSFGRQTGAKLPQHLSLLRRHGVPTRHRTSSPYPATGTQSPLPNRGFAQGSLPYAAPELLLSPTSATPYAAHPAQDIWALGVMLYTLLTGKLPFSDPFEPRLQMKILHGVFDMPQGVGRSAEQVLRGCIERSVPNRWTVAMVDEVAWGIGWGSATDDVTPPPEATMSCTASRSPSRENAAHSPVKTRRDHALDDKDIRRSTSRAPRSSSRSTSAVRAASRSKSRPPYELPYQHPLLQTNSHAAHLTPTQPSLASLTNAILRTSSGESSDSSNAPDSAIILQPVLSPGADVARGRLPRPRLHANVSVSRSRSPHDLPATPKDLSLDAVRRRKASPSRPTITTPDEIVPELDTVEEDERWQLSPDGEVDVDIDCVVTRSRSRPDSRSASGSGFSGSVSRSRGRPFSRPRDELRKVLRNESMPPALSPTRASAWIRAPAAVKEQGWYGAGCVTGAAAAATPIAIPGVAQSARSKSLGPDVQREGRFGRPLVSSSRYAK